MKPTDAIHSTIIRQHFHERLDNTDPPKTFKASTIAQELSHNELLKLGYETWREALPAFIELAFELREYGDCEILKGGKVLGEDVQVYDIQGDVTIRRKVGGERSFE